MEEIYMYQTVELMLAANPQETLEKFQEEELNETESGIRYFKIKSKQTNETSEN